MGKMLLRVWGITKLFILNFNNFPYLFQAFLVVFIFDSSTAII